MMPSNSEERSNSSCDIIQIAYTPFEDSYCRNRIERNYEALRRREHNDAVNYDSLRSAQRHAVCKQIFIATELNNHDVFEHTVQIAFNCWSCNISKSGLGAFVGKEIFPVNLIQDDVPPLLIKDVLRPGSKIQVGIPFVPREVKWIPSRITQLGITPEDLIDMGVRFSSPSKDAPLDPKLFQPFVEWLQPQLIDIVEDS